MIDLPFNKSGTKMIVQSGHKAFDRQSNIICGGSNMIANTQIRRYIRPFVEVECSGQIHEMGYLRSFDLAPIANMPPPVRDEILNLTNDEGIWVNVFFSHNGSKRIDHCWVLDRNHKFVKWFATGPTDKSWIVARYVIDVICDR